MEPTLRVVVLGGTGIVGSALSRRLAAVGWSVIATGCSKAHDINEVYRFVNLNIESDHSRRRFIELISDFGPSVIVDAIGTFSTAAIEDSKRVIQKAWWVNSVGRCRLLSSALRVLPVGATLVRLESSLGLRPLPEASVVSAAKASDLVLSVMLAEKCRKLSLFFGTVVLTAVAESLTPQQKRLFRRVYGFEAPNCEVVAEVIEKMIGIVRSCPGGARLLYPGYSLTAELDPLRRHD
jgi:NAD(P)-dependent dehydrogenase (short-subunit alcohol dehydrogenase family)